MLKTLYTCDQCGAEKKETNHWFLVREFLFDPAHPSCTAETARAELRVRFFADGAIPGDRHLCGQACLVQAVSEFASRSGSATPPPSAHLGAARTAPVLSSEDA